jgi:cytochrome c2
MSESAGETQSGGDDLWRWLVGGIVGGAIVLALLVGAYAAGYHRGQHHPRSAAAAASTVPVPSTTTETGTETASSSSGPIVATPALITRGRSLYTADGCSSCHSLAGEAGVGPSLKGIGGRKVTLMSGETITSDDAYLVESIVSPDKQIVKGYGSGIMSAATESHNFAGNPDDVRALVAFIRSQK